MTKKDRMRLRHLEVIRLNRQGYKQSIDERSAAGPAAAVSELDSNK